MGETQTPSETLAAAAVARLIEVGLLRPERSDALAAKIASGRMTSEDWRLQLDLAGEKAARA